MWTLFCFYKSFSFIFLKVFWFIIFVVGAAFFMVMASANEIYDFFCGENNVAKGCIFCFLLWFFINLCLVLGLTSLYLIGLCKHAVIISRSSLLGNHIQKIQKLFTGFDDMRSWQFLSSSDHVLFLIYFVSCHAMCMLCSLGKHKSSFYGLQKVPYTV